MTDLTLNDLELIASQESALKWNVDDSRKMSDRALARATLRAVLNDSGKKEACNLCCTFRDSYEYNEEGIMYVIDVIQNIRSYWASISK